MNLVPDLLSRPAGRIGAAAQNALEVARFGGLQTDEEPAPYEVFARRDIYRLRRYHASEPTGSRADRPALILVPPMMLAAEIYDVAEGTSAVTILHDHGIDPWVVDFGAPEKEEGGLERTLTDHVLAVVDAIERVREETGREPHIGGYSQGGMFCYQAASYLRGEGIASVVVFGSPVDTRGTLTFGLPEELITRGASFLAENLLANHALPAWASRTGFRLMDPGKSLRQRLEFLSHLHDREALLPRERQRKFMESEGWVAWPGPALADVIQQFGVHNRMLSGGFVIEGRMVTLADMSCPVLAFVGENDDIAPAHTVRAVRRAAPRSEVYETALPAGHFGLVVGSTAVETTWPTVAAWTRWRDGVDDERPDGVELVDPEDLPERDQGVGERIGAGMELAAGAGLGAAQALAGAAVEATKTMRELLSETAGQFGNLNRLGRMSPRTRISFGLLVDEQTADDPDEIALLFEERGVSREAVNDRIDNVVRGLLEIGVRQGEHVGVLMAARPSALTVVVALNRLGAVAVLMRPDGDTGYEAEIGGVRKIISDPERAAGCRDAADAQVYVLGGGGEERELGRGLIDMERIDPDEVTTPGWYEPNPGRASDLAYILFTGSGTRTRVNRITNGRWALSAFGTASAAGLTANDTVYSVTPVYHPSALLMTIGGAIAGGSRLALATEFSPETFWDEVRRYGATIVSYTWTMLDVVAHAPEHPAERHHPIRLFIGAGMPRSTWQRVQERFAPAGVLEFYASTEGDAVLVNVSGRKPGSKGRPLPGSAEVRIAAYDTISRQLEVGADGFAVPCARHETGMLLARVRPEQAANTSSETLRGVFVSNDAWLETGDLFRRDVDGDFWLVDHVTGLISTPDGVVPSAPIENALAELDGVRLAVAYGVPRAGGDEGEVAVAAVTLVDGAEIDPGDLDAALTELGSPGRPDLVWVVDEIPLTTWYRPQRGELRKLGIPEAGKSGRAWSWEEGRMTYVPLTAAARKRLAG